jgi:hypothetical protein
MKKSWIAFLTMVFCITLTYSVGAGCNISAQFRPYLTKMGLRAPEV